MASCAKSSRQNHWQRVARHGSIGAQVHLLTGDKKLAGNAGLREDSMAGHKASRREVLKGGSALIALGLGVNRARAREMTPYEKELYEAAKKEGELTWYTAQSDDVTAQSMGRDFESLFPGIKVQVVRTTAQVAFQRVSQEVRASAMQVDVLSTTDMGHCIALKEKKLLEK